MEEAYDRYEHSDSDEYEEVEGSEPEEEEEQEDPAVIREQQEFLKRREQIKKQIRQKMKKEPDSYSSQPQHKNGTKVNDSFGSFFGPSKPVIAARVLEESRSIRETKHMVAKQNRSGPVSTSTSMKTCADQRQQYVKEVPKVINRVKALKEARDYAFLDSNDADLPDTVKKEPAPRKVPVQNSGSSVRPAAGNLRPVSRNTAVQNSASKPARLVANGQHKNSSASRQANTKVVSKQAPPLRSKPDSVRSTVGNASFRNGSVGRPLGRETLQTKGSSREMIRPPAKTVNPSTSGSKRPSAKPLSSSQSQYSEQRRVSFGVDQNKPAPKLPPTARLQPMKPASARNARQDPPKRKPSRRDDPFEEDDADPIAMIRSMYKYNPNKYKHVDDADDSDMEVGFDSIMEEEERSRVLGKMEDEEQLRLLEEEEERERMRKKRKMKR